MNERKLWAMLNFNIYGVLQLYVGGDSLLLLPITETFRFLLKYLRPKVTNQNQIHEEIKSRLNSNLLCGLVVRVPGHRSRGPGFDYRRYKIFSESGTGFTQPREFN
jgi:hypothetical protein